MGERKGTNKYYPPDFDPQKHRNLAGYTGQHPLRERARKLGQGILIIRFEMPYNIWCDGCKNHIGMGVRYNAEKSKVGMYYTTPIYKFRMKCHLCNNHFEIKTDPANHDYVIISGARRKEQRWDPKENEQIVPEDKDSQKKFASDAMFKLEHGEKDKFKSKSSKSTLAQLESQQAQWKDDYDLNKLARSKFRNEKKSMKAQRDADSALLSKSSLNIDLVEENDEDVKLAKLMQYSSSKSFDEKQEEKRQNIKESEIFSALDSNDSPASTSSSPWQQNKQVAKQALQQIVKHGKAKKLDGHGFESRIGQKGSSNLSSLSLGIVKRNRDVDKAKLNFHRSNDSVESPAGDVNAHLYSDKVEMDSPKETDSVAESSAMSTSGDEMDPSLNSNCDTIDLCEQDGVGETNHNGSLIITPYSDSDSDQSAIDDDSSTHFPSVTDNSAHSAIENYSSAQSHSVNKSSAHSVQFPDTDRDLSYDRLDTCTDRQLTLSLCDYSNSSASDND